MLATHKDPKDKKSTKNVGSKVKQTGIEPGIHTFQVPEIKFALWSKKELKVDEEIEASAETHGMPDGKMLKFSFYEKNINTPDKLLGEIDLKVSGNKAKTTWKFPQSKVHNYCSGTYCPTVFFRVSQKELSRQSDQISLHSDLTIKLETEDGTAVSNELVEATLSNGLKLQLKTDNSGIAVFKKVPPCLQSIRFPKSPHAESITTNQINFFKPSPDKTAVPQGTKANVFRQITLFFYCLHKYLEQRRCAANTTFFEVVPEYKGGDAFKDEVTILSQVPRKLTVKGSDLKEIQNQYRMHSYSLECKQEFGGLLPEFWNVQFWQGLANPLEYQVSGLPRPLTVKCYRPDLFKLQIKFPAMRKWSGGRKENMETKDFAYQVKNKRPLALTEFEYKKEKTGWHLNSWPTPMTGELPILLQRNDQQITLDFLKSVGAIVDLAAKISLVLSAIQDNVPRIGWYFEWENQFFQGTFVIEWGWKEYKDHRAYFYVGFNIDIKLLDLKFEIGIGVSGFSIEFQVFGVLSGSISISLKGCRATPDGDAVLSLPFASEIVGSMGARFKGSYFIQAEGNVETGLKLNDGEFKFLAKEGVSFVATLQWTGIKAKLKVSAGPGKKKGTEEVQPQQAGNKGSGKEFKEQGSNDFEHELIGSVDLGKWQWPDATFKYNPPVIPRKDLLKLLNQKLSEGDDIRVKIGKGILLNDYMPISNVADQIEFVIHLEKNLRTDPKTMEALVLDIRKNLEKLMAQSPKESGYAHMSLAVFDKFLDHELRDILKKYIDPMRTIINQHP